MARNLAAAQLITLALRSFLQITGERKMQTFPFAESCLPYVVFFCSNHGPGSDVFIEIYLTVF